MIVLEGMTWEHRRAVDPLVGTLPAFRTLHPEIDVRWQARPLHGFEFTPIAELAAQHDFIVLDHPFCGDIAATGCLLPLDDLLAGMDDRFVGPSLATYRYRDRIWAMPIDAACPVAVSRPDLMARLDAGPPRDWEEVYALGERARRRGLKLAMGLKGVHALMGFFSLCASLGRPCATQAGAPLVEPASAREALGALRRLVTYCPPAVFEWNSIALHDRMAASDDLAYCPHVYCYATYAEADHAHPLRFHDLPGLGIRSPRGATIGGTGLGISARCRAPEAAFAYARYLLDPATQKSFAAHHGQPARIEAWTDPAIDLRFGGAFSATQATMGAAWIRPRYRGYLRLQAQGGDIVEAHLRGDLTEADTIERLERAHREAGV